MNIIEKSIQFAVQAHEGAVRKGTDVPYILHPLEAAAIAARITNDQDVIAAAVLHDVIEDTSFTYEDISAEFGGRIADLVKGCTENKRRDLPAAETWMIRKQETVRHLETAPREVKTIVFADKLSNLRSMTTEYIATGEPFWDRFECREPQKHVWYYTALLDSFEEFGDTLLYKEYLRLLRTLSMWVREYEETGGHDADALEVIATPDSGYWVLRTKKSDDYMLMTEEELEEFINNRS